MKFGMAVHDGSVRCLSVCSKPSDASQPYLLVSGGFDESLRMFDLSKEAEAGESKTPQDLGTPTCSSFAPPQSSASHYLVGLSSGKIALYKRKDWSIVHVLSGHDGGVHCVACHPSGKLALSGGRNDGSLKLWDLTKGRLAFVHKIPSKKMKSAVNSIVWSKDGSKYAFCYDKHVTARDVNTGEDLVDIELPSRPNQICIIGGENESFLACACDDGSLPVIHIGVVATDGEEYAIRAVMAVEPVDRTVVGDDRFKCIQSVNNGSGYCVVTANSGGVISLIDLEDAAKQLLEDDDENDSNNNSSNENSSDDSSDSSEGLAVFLQSVRVGSGARVTNIVAWSCDYDTDDDQPSENDKPAVIVTAEEIDETPEAASPAEVDDTKKKSVVRSRKRKIQNGKETIELDENEIAKARELVAMAKKRQKKKKDKNSKPTKKS